MEINEQKLTGILQEQREEFQRYLGVTVEKFEGHVKLLAESVAALAETVRGIQRQIEKIYDQIEELREMVVKNTEDIEVIKNDIVVIKSDIGIIKNELKQKVDRDEFAMLEGRVASLEAKLNR